MDKKLTITISYRLLSKLYLVGLGVVVFQEWALWLFAGLEIAWQEVGAPLTFPSAAIGWSVALCYAMDRYVRLHDPRKN